MSTVFSVANFYFPQFMTENKKLLSATGVIGSGTMLSRVFGFIRDMVIANVFGAGLTTDAFFVAFKIPNLLRRLLGEGALSAAFIPVFTEYHTLKSREETWKFANAILSTLFLVLVVITCLGIVFMPWVITVLAPGFHGDSSKFDLAVQLTRMTFPYVIFICLAAAAMGILNSLRHFIVPAYAPVLLNFSLIASVFFLCPNMDPPVSGLAIGVIVGGFLQLLVNIIALKKKGLRFRFDFSLNHPGVKRVALLMAPFIVGLSVTQINIFVDTLIASFLAEGSISFLYYADRIVQLPLGVFGTALGTAILPSLSSLAAKKDNDGIRDTVAFGLRFTLFITIPAMIALIVLALPIVTILFERGHFDIRASSQTAKALVAYTLGLWAFSGIKILSSAYYSLKDTRTPVIIACVSMISNIVLNLLLMGPFKHSGIALATSISSILNLALLIYYLEGSIGKLKWGEIIISLLKITAASLVMGAVCYIMAPKTLLFETETGQAIWMGTIVISGLSVYLITAYAMRCSEIHFLVEMVVKKIKKG